MCMVAVTETEVIQHNVTVTSTHLFEKSVVISSPCAQPLPDSVHDSAHGLLQTGSTPLGAGDVIAVVLAVLLLVQVIACTVALVVCSKRRKEKTKHDERG